MCLVWFWCVNIFLIASSSYYITRCFFRCFEFRTSKKVVCETIFFGMHTTFQTAEIGISNYYSSMKCAFCLFHSIEWDRIFGIFLSCFFLAWKSRSNGLFCVWKLWVITVITCLSESQSHVSALNECNNQSNNTLERFSFPFCAMGFFFFLHFFAHRYYASLWRCFCSSFTVFDSNSKPETNQWIFISQHSLSDNIFCVSFFLSSVLMKAQTAWKRM